MNTVENVTLQLQYQYPSSLSEKNTSVPPLTVQILLKKTTRKTCILFESHSAPFKDAEIVLCAHKNPDITHIKLKQFRVDRTKNMPYLGKQLVCLFLGTLLKNEGLSAKSAKEIPFTVQVDPLPDVHKIQFRYPDAPVNDYVIERYITSYGMDIPTNGLKESNLDGIQDLVNFVSLLQYFKNTMGLHPRSSADREHLTGTVGKVLELCGRQTVENRLIRIKIPDLYSTLSKSEIRKRQQQQQRQLKQQRRMQQQQQLRQDQQMEQEFDRAMRQQKHPRQELIITGSSSSSDSPEPVSNQVTFEFHYTDPVLREGRTFKLPLKRTRYKGRIYFEVKEDAVMIVVLYYEFESQSIELSYFEIPSGSPYSKYPDMGRQIVCALVKKILLYVGIHEESRQVKYMIFSLQASPLTEKIKFPYPNEKVDDYVIWRYIRPYFQNTDTYVKQMKTMTVGKIQRFVNLLILVNYYTESFGVVVDTPLHPTMYSVTMSGKVGTVLQICKTMETTGKPRTKKVTVTFPKPHKFTTYWDAQDKRMSQGSTTQEYIQQKQVQKQTQRQQQT